MKKCVFFDRDGIVNASPGAGWVTRWEEFRLLPEFVAVLRAVSEAGYVAVIISNQRIVSLGKLSAEALDDIHARFRQVLRDEHGLDVLDIFYCPHGDGECTCRKPQPGMFLAAAEKHGIDVSASWMIGDQERDVVAGKAAGCRTILVLPGDEASVSDIRVPDMKALESLITEGNVLT
jgi:D-glycero-D-manno-heptose 1,7-bisphosphate phosphatase